MWDDDRTSLFMAWLDEHNSSVTAIKTNDWLAALGGAALLIGFVSVLYYWIYRMNQYAVHKWLKPQREELLALLSSLDDESAGEASLKYPILMSDKPCKRWSWRTLLVVLCVLATVLIAVPSIRNLARRVVFQDSTSSGEEHPTTEPMNNSQTALSDLISRLRMEKRLVGLAAMVVVDGEVVASAVDGERKNGSSVRLEIGDRWHLGSITKSITATMIGRLLESGQIEWTDTIGEYIPESSIHDDWKPVTLRQLLTHTSGAPANFSLQVRLRQPPMGPERTQARRDAVLEVLAGKPAYPPGEKFAYSNVGYTIAGAMAEQATGATWEELVEREVFEPLRLNAAGFGPPKSSDEALEQPRGHRAGLLWGKVAMGDDADNTPIMGPAGTVHMTLSDLCAYATEHLRGHLGAGQLLSADTYKLLHAPELDQYACGWVQKEPSDEIPHMVYWHNGSNTMWYALVAFVPETKMVVAVTSNDGDIGRAESAAWEIVQASVSASADKR